MGIVRAEAIRGFFLAQDAANPPHAAGEESDKESLYFQIAEDRLAGRLPDRMSEDELMRQFNVARRRLIKVLHQIAEEGWIERLPGNGWEFRETLTIDLAEVKTSVAGPRRPQDRLSACGTAEATAKLRTGPIRPAPPGSPPDGAVAIAAITRCTNTSDPHLMVQRAFSPARRAPWVLPRRRG